MKKLLIASSLAFVSVTAVAAEERGFYINAGFGQAQYDVSQDDLDELALFEFDAIGVTVIDAESTLDDKGSAWSLAGGYRFSPYFAAEVGYLDLGSAKYRGEGTVFVPGFGILDGALDLEASAKGPALAASGVLPLNDRFDFHAHLGVFFADVKSKATMEIDGVRETVRDSVSSENLFLGAGAAYRFTQNFGVSLDYSLFKDVGDDEEIGEADVSAWRLSAQYRF